MLLFPRLYHHHHNNNCSSNNNDKRWFNDHLPPESECGPGLTRSGLHPYLDWRATAGPRAPQVCGRNRLFSFCTSFCCNVSSVSGLFIFTQVFLFVCLFILGGVDRPRPHLASGSRSSTWTPSPSVPPGGWILRVPNPHGRKSTIDREGPLQM